ncbi:MAG: YfdX family protein [Gammaproteobacteria bacterium]|nr:YfdX family protein [Gammaproteobacteria bacterium]
MNVTTYDVLADLEAVKRLKEEAEVALEEGRTQEARRLIKDLASETVIEILNVPLATYPEAMRSAAGLIDEGKAEEAGTRLPISAQYAGGNASRTRSAADRCGPYTPRRQGRPRSPPMAISTKQHAEKLRDCLTVREQNSGSPRCLVTLQKSSTANSMQNLIG